MFVCCVFPFVCIFDMREIIARVDSLVLLLLVGDLEVGIDGEHVVLDGGSDVEGCVGLSSASNTNTGNVGDVNSGGDRHGLLGEGGLSSSGNLDGNFRGGLIRVAVGSSDLDLVGAVVLDNSRVDVLGRKDHG